MRFYFTMTYDSQRPFFCHQKKPANRLFYKRKEYVPKTALPPLLLDQHKALALRLIHPASSPFFQVAAHYPGAHGVKNIRSFQPAFPGHQDPIPDIIQFFHPVSIRINAHFYS
jgi:hypothetical protein